MATQRFCFYQCMAALPTYPDVQATAANSADPYSELSIGTCGNRSVFLGTSNSLFFKKKVGNPYPPDPAKLMKIQNMSQCMSV